MVKFTSIIFFSNDVLKNMVVIFHFSSSRSTDQEYLILRDFLYNFRIHTFSSLIDSVSRHVKIGHKNKNYKYVQTKKEHNIFWFGNAMFHCNSTRTKSNSITPLLLNWRPTK